MSQLTDKQADEIIAPLMDFCKDILSQLPPKRDPIEDAIDSIMDDVLEYASEYADWQGDHKPIGVRIRTKIKVLVGGN